MKKADNLTYVLYEYKRASARKKQFALALLENAMETMLLYEIYIENFNQLVKDLDSLIPDFSNKNEEI